MSYLFGNNKCKTTFMVNPLQIGCIKHSVRLFVIFGISCTARGFLGHSLKEDCAILTISIERSIQWPNEEDSPPSLKRKLFSKPSAVAVPKQKCAGATISTKINSQSGSATCLKMGPRCSSLRISDPSDDEKRIAHLEHARWKNGGRVRHPKKTIDRIGLTLAEKRCHISALQQEYSVRDICEVLDVNRGSLYYQPKADPSEAVLLAEIEKLAGAYPRYGYRRITRLLVRQGYTVGTRRVAG